MKVINRRARYDYYLLERFEAGIALTGPEVKSIKTSRINLQDSFVRVRHGQAWLHNAHVSPYPYADNRDYDPKRTRKLLLHKNELLGLTKKMEGKRLTLVPTSCYTKKGKIKVEIALARGKKKWDKREAIKRRDLERETKREL